MRAGSIVVFTSLTPHYTERNTTDDVRKAYIVQYAPDGAVAYRPQADGSRGPAEPLDDERRQYAVVRDGRLRRRLTWTRPSRRAAGARAARSVRGRARTGLRSRRLEAVQRTIGAVAALDPERALADAARSDTAASPTEPTRSARRRADHGQGLDRRRRVADHRVRPATSRPPARAATRPRLRALRAAGAVVAGITTALAESPAHGRTRQPRATRPARPVVRPRAPRPSSRAGASPLALGSDSGGSIRLPAAWCGVYGLKPTFGRVPLTGHFPRLGARSDARTVIGPLANSVDDLARRVATHRRPRRIRRRRRAGRRSEIPQPCRRRRACASDSSQRCDRRSGHARRRDLRAAGRDRGRRRRSDVRDEAMEITRRYWQRWKQPPLDRSRVRDAADRDWDRFERKLLVATADTDALLMPATTAPAPPWRESIDTDYVWQLPWSLTGSPAVVMPYGADGALPLVGPDRQPTVERPHRARDHGAISRPPTRARNP